MERTDGGSGAVILHVDPVCDNGQMYTELHLGIETISGDIIERNGEEFHRGLMQTSFSYVVEKHPKETHHPTVAIKECLTRLMSLYQIPKHVRTDIWTHVLNSRLFDDYTSEYFAEHSAKMVRVPSVPKPEPGQLVEFKTTNLDSIPDYEVPAQGLLGLIDEVLIEEIAKGNVVIDNPITLLQDAIDGIDIHGPFGINPTEGCRLDLRGL